MSNGEVNYTAVATRAERERGARLGDIARCIHSVFTKGGSESSGIAEPFIDGRIDALGLLLADDGERNDDQGVAEVSHFASDGAQFREPSDASRCDSMGPFGSFEEECQTVDRVDASEMSYEDFYERYMSRNVPVLINGLTEGWRAANEWVEEPTIFSCDGAGKPVPNVNRILELFEDDVVTVHLQNQGGFIGASTHRRRKKDMALRDYCDWWAHHHSAFKGKNGEQIIEKTNGEHCYEDEDLLLYLKDWKFVAEHPEYEAYVCPHFFADDWLNGATGMGNAYKFVYLGPRGTVTPLHADVLNSYSWSTNICGRKIWYLVPPQWTHLLYDVFGKQLASHMHSDLDYGDGGMGRTLFPGIAAARKRAWVIVQEEGETLFVPSGWHHTVENLAPTLSINHNWINGTNIFWSWDRIRRELTNSLRQDDARIEREAHREKNILSQPTEEQPVKGDDLLLFWLVLSKKSREILSRNVGDPGSLQKVRFSDRMSCMRGRDLHNIHLILLSMEKFLAGECGRRHTNFDMFDVQMLIQEIERHFKPCNHAF